MNTYIQQKQSELFKKVGVFFAFSQNQFDEKKAEGVEYTQIAGLGGAICPSDKVDFFLTELDKIHQEGIEKELAEKSREQIIIDELNNRECFYQGTFTDTIEHLEPYGIYPEEIHRVFMKENKRRIEANED